MKKRPSGKIVYKAELLETKPEKENQPEKNRPTTEE